MTILKNRVYRNYLNSFFMKKIISFLIASILLFTQLIPLADAATRVIRKTRNTQVNSVYNPYYQTPYYYPVTQTSNQPIQMYQNPQIYATSAGSTYYYSPTYVQGYTYYSVPTPGYYYYSSVPAQSNTVTNTQQGQYYFSPTYIQGYTYYSTPNPGYYYYYNTTSTNNYYYNQPYYNPRQNNGNMICTIVDGAYRCNTSGYAQTAATYPGCSQADIVIGGQIWASCNALDRNVGSTAKTGWFFAGDRESSFTSYNGTNTALEWMGKQTRESSWTVGPCASGYRLPTRGEWETLQSYARANGTSIASLISLEQNGAYQGVRNTNGDISISGRLSVAAAYWSSSVDGNVPMVMHLGSSYAGYNTNGTDYGYVNNGYRWTYTDTGLELLRSTTGELANVRCIRL